MYMYMYIHVAGLDFRLKGYALHVLSYMYIHVHESHPRQLIFLRKSDSLGCAVLLCLVVCLT